MGSNPIVAFSSKVLSPKAAKVPGTMLGPLAVFTLSVGGADGACDEPGSLLGAAIELPPTDKVSTER